MSERFKVVFEQVCSVGDVEAGGEALDCPGGMRKEGLQPLASEMKAPVREVADRIQRSRLVTGALTRCFTHTFRI